MIKDDLEALIRQNFTHTPTSEQEAVLSEWCDFLLSAHSEEIFLLRGYAGTGKTSLVGALVKTLRQLERHVVLLAPTGRAAKVFALYAEHQANTIHRRIYRQKTFSPDMTNFVSNVNLQRTTLFIVDEASMIANEGLSGGMFGGGRLLDDLVHFVYAGQGCRLLLVGDSAQLPPVGEEVSPALSKEALESYGLIVREAELKQVLRQVSDSGILWNATMLRKCLMEEAVYEFPKMRISGFADIQVVPGNELIESLESSYYHTGTDQTIVVTRSNHRANIFNQGIRGRILYYEEELTGGDHVIVVKNNYHYGLTEEGEGESFIANGDSAIVRRVRNERKFYGFRFADATLSFPDYDNAELEATVMLDTLQAEAPALTKEQQEKLFTAICEDYPEITNKRDLMKKVKEDPYYNALQIKYAYAVTCHKAQGGQWQHVYIDQGYITEDMLSPDYFRWLYTAITRATEKVFLINWSEQQTE